MKKYFICILLLSAAAEARAGDSFLSNLWTSIVGEEEVSPFFQELEDAFDEAEDDRGLSDFLKPGEEYSVSGKCFWKSDRVGSNSFIEVKRLLPSCFGNGGEFFDNVETGCHRGYIEIDGRRYNDAPKDFDYSSGGYSVYRLVEHKGRQYAIERYTDDGEARSYCSFLLEEDKIIKTSE